MGKSKRFIMSGILYLGLTWLSLGLLGYSLALKKYGEESSGKAGAPNGAVSAVVDAGDSEERTGRVTWASIDWPRSRGARFKLEGSDDPIYLPDELVGEERRWKAVEQYLKPGTRLRAKIRKRGMIALDLKANPDTPFQRPILSAEGAQEKLSRVNETADQYSRFFFGLGVLILPLAITLHLGIPRLLRLRKKIPARA